MTSAFSAEPDRKYLAAVSIEACPSNAWTWAGSAPPWRSRVPKVCRQRWGRRPLMPASAPAASTTWVMPEMVSGPRWPCQAGPRWRPRTSSQAETSSRARRDSGTKRTSSPLPCRRTSPVRAVIAKSSASRRAHSSARAGVQQHSDDRRVAGSAAPLRAADRALLPGSERVRLAQPGDAGRRRHNAALEWLTCACLPA